MGICTIVLGLKEMNILVLVSSRYDIPTGRSVQNKDLGGAIEYFLAIGGG